jgi:uncharacterized membrane protein
MDDRRLETMIGNLLRAGVLLAAAIVLAGGAVYLLQHHADKPTYRIFTLESQSLRSLPGIVHSAVHLERDRLYEVVSLIVLAILTFSLLHAS